MLLPIIYLPHIANGNESHDPINESSPLVAGSPTPICMTGKAMAKSGDLG
jgi:hypothetical protein